MISAERLIELFGMKPLEAEGGFFVQTYRSEEALSGSALPDRYRGPRPLGTAIYYLLKPETFSAMHRLATDEVYHFYLGEHSV